MPTFVYRFTVLLGHVKVRPWQLHYTDPHSYGSSTFMCWVSRRGVHRSNIFMHTDNWNRFLHAVNHVKQTACRPACGQRIYVLILLLPLHSLLMSCTRYFRNTAAHSVSTADTNMPRSSSAAFHIETCCTSIVADVKHGSW